ncbi:ap4a phosphorylase ii [Nannochloropsis gaditana]|uniref:Ap4a phosphorylase ii n=1 Tax=Nannochloropsis gaditana TaxID=72520 RepID=W7T6Z6_9STRA|nr:ap4a phosphorylase ii [Nannochloropsis gaditana]
MSQRKHAGEKIYKMAEECKSASACPPVSSSSQLSDPDDNNSEFSRFSTARGGPSTSSSFPTSLVSSSAAPALPPQTWQPMETSTTQDLHRPHASPDWWSEASQKTTQCLDVASELFAEHRRLGLGLAALLMCLGIWLNVNGNANGGFTGGGASIAPEGAGLWGRQGQEGDLPSPLRRLIQETRARALGAEDHQMGSTGASAPALQPLPTQREFPTMTDHLLLVTEAWHPQAGLLRADDLIAWWELLRDVPAVGFFNSGPEAGASQGHRHLQAIPVDALSLPSLPPIRPTLPVPMDVLIGPHLASLPPHSALSTSQVLSLPFRHRIAPLPPSPTPAELQRVYRRLLEEIGVVEMGQEVEGGPGVEEETKAHNLVMTKEWLLAVPRSQAKYAGVDVNGMAFLGCLLSGGAETTQTIKRFGPFNILKAVVPP